MKTTYLKYSLLVIVLGFTFCKKEETSNPTSTNIPTDSLIFTTSEITTIENGDTATAMRVLVTTNHDDSLILRTTCRNITPDSTNASLVKLIRRMYHTMIDSGGVGIAAPQVGIKRNIIWVKRLDKTGRPYEYYLNPRIVLYSNKTITFPGDGCLSIPNRSGNTHRYSSVVVEYDRLDGSHHQEIIGDYSYSNFTSVIFQHEIDHLNGILFIDRL